MAQFWILTKIYVTVSLSKDTNAMTQLEAVKGVFHAQVGRYTLTFYDAQRLCALLGATLATHDQLYTAWEAGLQKCAWVVLYSCVCDLLVVSIIPLLQGVQICKGSNFFRTA